MKTSIYWGCTISNTLPYLTIPTKKLLGELGIEAEEIDGWTCCPDPVSAKAYSHDGSLALSARNMALAGDKMIVACSGCYNTFHKAHKELEYLEKRKDVNDVLEKDERYEKSVEIEHVLDTIYNNVKIIQTKIKKPLKGLNVAVHYGCHALWPQAVKSDHPETPTSIDEIINALGATSVDYEHKMDCCGVPIAAFNAEESDALLKNKLIGAKEKADCIVTVCPTCFIQFDRLSKDMRENALPVFYITELIGLALGFTPEEMELRMHGTSVKPALDKLGIASDHEKKLGEVKKYFDYSELICHCEACRVECTEAQMTKDGQRPFDPVSFAERLAKGELDEVLEDEHMWLCLQCGKCLSRCPNNIGLKDMFLKLREVAVEKGKAPESIKMKMDMIRDTGYGMRVNEMVRKRIGMEPTKQADPKKMERIINSKKKK